MAKVAILSLGGTIAMGALAAGGGVKPSLNAQDLIAAVPGLGDLAELEAIALCNLPSAHLSFPQAALVVAQIKDLESRGFDGVVITQGTDTIEETSWLLDLTVQTSLAVVVTGAMRNPTQAGADGPANLLASVQVASSDAARGQGVLVVFNDQIHAARYVQKTHSSNVAAFASPTAGPLGWMAQGVAQIPMRLAPVPSFNVDLNAALPVVPIVKPGIGEGAALLNAMLESGIDGLVFEGAGGGHCTPDFAQALGRAAKTVPVVLCSRTRAGSVLTHTYGYEGAEIDLLSRGVTPSGCLDALKARIMLMLALLDTDDAPAAKARFAQVIGQMV